MFARTFLGLTLWLCATAQSNNGNTIYRPYDPGVTPPVATFHPEPDYTKQARDKKIQGTVRVWILIGKDGKVQNLKVEKPLEPSLDANALKTVKTWQFTPCQKDGNPVYCSLYAEVSFHLQ